MTRYDVFLSLFFVLSVFIVILFVILTNQKLDFPRFIHMLYNFYQ